MRLTWTATVVALVACHSAKPPVAIAPLPRAAYAHYLAGKAALYHDDPGGAADELAAALTAAPDQPVIAVELARALAKAKRDTAARDVLADARKRWPNHPQVWLASGDVLAATASGDRPSATAAADAIRAYRRAIELAPDDEHGYLGLARVAAGQDDAATAERTLRQLVSKVPASVDGHYRLAQRLVATGDLPAVTVELHAVLERDPDHIDARLELARALRRLGKLDEAIAQTRSAFDRAAQPLDIAEELFWLLCEADDRQAAIDLLTLLDDDRSDAEALTTIARLDIQLGRLAEAASIATRIQDVDAAHVLVVAIDLAKHDTAGAAQHALAIMEGAPAFADARRLAAEAALVDGQPQRALELLEPARRAKPDDVDVALTTATALADLHRVDDARAVIAGLHADPLPTALVRAHFEDHLHDSAAALAILEPALRAHPDHVTTLNLTGYLLADRGERLDDAERYLRRARELQPGDPAILDSWGWLLLRRGNTRGAIRALDRAARFAPLEPEILLHLAQAWAADHAPRTAAEVLDRALARHPSPDVRRRIDAVRSTLAAR
jgi:tetratricopeptide (TPR) repeat protein